MADYTQLMIRLRNAAPLAYPDLNDEAADAIEALAREIAEQAKQIANLKTVMVAAAEEISAHWDAHCDAAGYGPANLMRRLEDGIPSEYGYTAGAFAKQAAQIEALRADAAVWKCQVDSLRDALHKVLDTRNKEAKAAMSYQTARENYSDDTDERKAHERAMLSACDAEREARILLLTLKDIADAAPVSGKAVTP